MFSPSINNQNIQLSAELVFALVNRVISKAKFVSENPRKTYGHTELLDLVNRSVFRMLGGNRIVKVDLLVEVITHGFNHSEYQVINLMNEKANTSLQQELYASIQELGEENPSLLNDMPATPYSCSKDEDWFIPFQQKRFRK